MSSRTNRNTADKEERKRSLNEISYQKIKEAILTSRLQPGHKLSHQDLAELLGVSRTPVRESLERLLQEGYVTRILNRGFFVAKISLSEAHELYGMREALELHQLMRLFEEGGAPLEKIAELREINERYHQLMKNNLPDERRLADREFHLCLARTVNNETIVLELSNIFDRLVVERHMVSYMDILHGVAYKEHSRLITAIEKKKFRQAERLLRAHIRGGYERFADKLRQAPQGML